MSEIVCHSYTLNDFMEIPNLALKLALIKPFRRANEPRPSLLSWIFFSLGAANLVYQNFGIVIALLMDRNETVDILLQISESGSILGLTMVALCKMIILFWYRKDIVKLMDEFEDLLTGALKLHGLCRQNHYRTKYFVEFSRNLMKLVAIFYAFAFLTYNVPPILESIFEWLILGKNFQKRFQSNTWYPWNGNSNVGYILTYSCQLCSSLSGVAFICSGEFMLCFFLTQMRMHFDFLAKTLETLDAVKSEADPNCLRFLINYHNTLIRLSTEINDVFNISFLVNFATSSVAICLMGCSIVLGIRLLSVLRYSVGLTSFLVFTLFICYNGSEFTYTTAQLHSSLFYHNWYDASPAYRRKIFFIMMRSAKPSMLQAYKFSTVSMETFKGILTFSYQLFTFLQAIEG